MATAASPKTLTPAEWQACAITLADEQHMTYTPRRVDSVTYAVPSRDRRGTHFIELLAGGAVRCDCTAGTYGRPCCHAGAVLHAERIRTQAHDDAFATFAITGEW